MQHYCEHCKKFIEARRAPFSSSLICSICGSEFGAGYLAAGTIVSGFRIEEEIGRGSFGVVYKALQLNLERMVALKVLSDELARDSEFVDNFFREARLAASLSHPNIVQAFDAGATTEGIYYFAMELIEGETLEARIHRAGRLEVADAIPIALKIAKALDYAWDRQKLTHGDIKPENIILNSSGEAKLADLGLAKTVHEDHSGHLMVTPLYAPPEIISGMNGFDSMKADIYSFGATFYHMLAGIPPFNENDPDKVMEMHLNQIPESLGERFRVNSDISFITDRMLAKNPDERPQGWREIVESVEAVDLDLPRINKSTRRISVSINKRDVARQKKTIAAIIVAMVLTIIFLISLLWSISKTSEKNALENNTSNVKQEKDYEWNKLKTDIKFLSEKKALELVKTYIDNKKDSIPDDALKTLNSLKREKQEAEKKKKCINSFDEKLGKLKNKLHKLDYSATSPRELMSLQAKIVDLFKQVSEHKFLYNRISEKDRKFLSLKIKKLKEAILNNNPRQTEYSVADKNKISRLESMLLERKRKRIINDEIDRFVAATSKFSSYNGRKRTLKAFFYSFKNVSPKDLPTSYYTLYSFIRNVYKYDKSVNSIIISSKQLFYGDKLFSKGTYAGYKVARIESPYIFLEKKLDYGVLKKKLKLTKIKSRSRLKIAYDKFIKKDNLVNLDSESCTILLRGLLNYHEYNKFDQFLKKANQYSESQKHLWQELRNSFGESKREAAAIKLWGRTLSYYKAGKYASAIKKLQEIVQQYIETNLYLRRNREIVNMIKLLGRISPEIQAAGFASKFEDAAEAKNYPLAFQYAVVNWDRYGQLKVIPESLAGELLIDKNKAISWLHSYKNKVNIPFFSWEHYPIAGAWMLNNKFKAENIPQTVKESLKLLSGIDTGIWDNIEEYVYNCKSLEKLVEFYKKKKKLKLAVAIIYGYGFAAVRYGDSRLEKSAAEELKKLAVDGDIMTKVIYSEYCGLRRQWSEADSIIKSVDFNSDTSNDAFRLAAVDMLFSLQGQEFNIDAFCAKIKRYRQSFSSNYNLNGDFKWLEVAERILQGQFKENDIEILKKKRCFAVDVCSRIVTDAAVSMCSRNAFPIEKLKEILKINEHNISGNTASTGLWQKNTVAKLAVSNDLHSFERQLDFVDEDCRICSISFYPYFVMLRIGCESIRRDIPKSSIPVVFESFMNYCPIVANSERKMRQLFDGSIRAPQVINRLLSEKKYQKAFWVSAAGMLINYYNNSECIIIGDIIKQQYKFLNWEERFFLNRLEKIISK